jgi:drug/metabolite transporter (DMT)-like permease
VVCFLPLLRFAKPHPEITENYSSSSSLSHNKVIITEDNRRSMFWRFSFELALLTFGTEALQNSGLVTTQSARVAFLVQLSVVITPALSALLGHKVHLRVWCACFVALLGLFVLSHGGTSSLAVKLTKGDVCCLGSALCWSCYIYRLSAWGEYFDETMSQFCKNVILAPMYSIWMVVSLISSDNSLWEGWRDPISWLLLFYSALGPGTIADIIQQKAQSNVPAAEANVILSLEPVFTAIFGVIFLGELLSWHEVFGGGLIVVASILSSY